MMLTFVTATRFNQELFLSQSMLGRSLRRMEPLGPYALQLFWENTRALGACYNEVIDTADPETILCFLHDDLFIEDWYVSQRLQDALAVFDVVGVAGNRRRQPQQSTWWAAPNPAMAGAGLQASTDPDLLSGAIAHGQAPHGEISVFGTSPQDAALLDGVFLAARAGLLQRSGVRFDPSLGFHFYDLDFCRSAIAAGLRVGTWPIALTHGSRGESLHSQAWAESKALYQRKWGD
jgi:GT2 family glycosyltransferase